MFNFNKTVLLTVCLLSFLVVLGNAIPKNILKNKVKLIYDITNNNDQYQLAIIIEYRKEGVNLIWNASSPINKKGYFFIQNEAIQKSNTFYDFNEFKNEEINDKCFLFLSKYMYNNWKLNKNIEIVFDKKTTYGNAYNHTQNFEYKNNNSTEFDCITVSDLSPESNNTITFVNDYNFPLIIEISGTWTMKLRKIIDPIL